MIILSPSGTKYHIKTKIGTTEKFTLYECLLPDNRVCIFKITTDIKYNGLLDREAYLLQTMRQEAESLEKEYASIKEGDQMLNYQFLFPDLTESFIVKEQSNRRVNILGFPNIADELSQLVPISHLISRDKVRVDPRTSAWILGKLLKLLVFAHAQGIAINLLTGENILINREQHFVAVFDWSKSIIGGSEVIPEIAAREISQVATEITLILRGDPHTGQLLANEQLVDNRYADFIQRLVSRRVSEADKAHSDFYKLVRSLWPREFYPFTTINI